jgi:hypothetical protein
MRLPVIRQTQSTKLPTPGDRSIARVLRGSTGPQESRTQSASRVHAVVLPLAGTGGVQDEALSDAMTDKIITVLVPAPLRPGEGGRRSGPLQPVFVQQGPVA